MYNSCVLICIRSSRNNFPPLVLGMLFDISALTGLFSGSPCKSETHAQKDQGLPRCVGHQRTPAAIRQLTGRDARPVVDGCHVTCWRHAPRSAPCASAGSFSLEGICRTCYGLPWPRSYTTPACLSRMTGNPAQQTNLIILRPHLIMHRTIGLMGTIGPYRMD